MGEVDNAAGELAINPLSGGTLTINNTSPGTAIIDAQGHSRVFDINPNNTAFAATAHIIFNGNAGGITVTNGRAGATDDPAGSGGDIRDNGRVGLELNNVTVSNGTGGGDGGGIAMENLVSTPWTLTLNHSTVINNHAMDAGGGIDEDGTGTVNINNSLITGNSTVNQSGGIWLDAVPNQNTGALETANLNISQSVISNNFSGMLGAGFGNAGNGTVTVTNSTIAGNVTHGFGGGFADQNNLGTLSVTNSLFQNNTSVTAGGAIFAGGPSTTITDSEFRGNFADTNGGALFLGQNATATTSNFAISNSTFTNNSANGNGGAIEFESVGASTSTATITNSTVAGNSALGGIGGGIDVASGFIGAVTLTADTVTNNFATTQGGGVAFAGTAGGAVKVQNTIIANNVATTGPDVFNTAGTFTDQGNNVLGTVSGSTGFTAGTDLTGPFTNLVSGLRDNGGPVAGVTQFYGAGLVGNNPTGQSITVQTEALPTFSPPATSSSAIGKGAAGVTTTDERGFPRPGTTSDVGAFQFQNAALTLNLTATNSNGTTTVTVTVTNTSGNNLPADNSVLSVTLPSTLTPNGATSFTLPALAAGQHTTFTLTATGTPTAPNNTVTASVFSPDANPNAVSTTPVTIVPPGPTPHTPQGALLVFSIGIVNNQFVWLYVDQAGQVFDEAVNLNNPFANFFSPNPADAVFVNTNLMFSNIQFQQSGVFGGPALLGNVLDFNNNPILMETIPLNFIGAAALNDILHAPGV